MGFFDKMKETLTSTSTGVTQKINSTTDIMKCNTKIKNNEKEIEKLIYQVGSEHVSRHLFDDVSEHAALFDQIKALQAENQSITAEIERIKEEQENARLAEEARRQDAAMQRELAKRQQEAKIQQELKNMQEAPARTHILHRFQRSSHSRQLLPLRNSARTAASLMRQTPCSVHSAETASPRLLRNLPQKKFRRFRRFRQTMSSLPMMTFYLRRNPPL